MTQTSAPGDTASAQGHILVLLSDLKTVDGVEAYCTLYRLPQRVVMMPHWSLPREEIIGPTVGVIAHGPFLSRPHNVQIDQNVPWVTIGRTPRDNPYVIPDYAASGRLAGEYFRTLRLPHLAFAGVEGAANSDAMQRGFSEHALQAGLDCNLAPLDVFTLIRGGEDEPRRFIRWLRDLPKPLGLLSPFGQAALCITILCRQYDIQVPEEVAVLSGNDEPQTCLYTSPAITMVLDNHWQMGYEAARLLHAQLRGEPIAVSPVQVPAVRIQAHASTDTLAVDDPRLAAAVAHIRQNACADIRIDRVARQAGLSRRNLELLMKRHLGLSVLEEITRVRIQHAKELLGSSDLSLAEIAVRCGLKWANSLSKLFARHVGMPPGTYRKRARQAMRSGRNVWQDSTPPESD